ncbi:hypothetical protein POTOM_002352 [Populus tomentosa]|uniref:Uncharacterized protein n=1 Tax=Populus tomentosa TaxID=118781 RepID=A0A8X8DJS0_POPTO|nr:hypothetical protein POTOM_002352 [Populus tomentosa]
MDLNSPPVEMFFPFVGGGHQVPMIDIARVFASHGAKATIITTPKHSLSFQTSIHRDLECGLPISIHALELSDNVDVADTDMSANSYTDTSMLQEPLQNLLLERKPDCIVHDVFHRWSADAIDSAGIPRITFNGNGCFAHCVRENMERYKPHEKVTSDLEPFIVSGLPDGIELTTSQLPFLGRPPNGGGLHKRMPGSDEKSFGVMVNSFYELETAYVDSFRNELGKRDRFHYAIEIGLEDRIKESRRGLIIRGRAPQLLILEHPAVGGFVTHCGWNSTLEGVSAGMPMVTWPITAEQFTNEKLITDVLKIGVKVGSMHWMSPRTESRVSVGRDKVEAAVKRLMGSGEEAAEMRRRAEKLGVKAKIAVEEGGSSCKNADALIQELKSRRQS